MYLKYLQFVRSRPKKVALVCNPFPFNELFWIFFEACISQKASQKLQSYYILLFPYPISVVWTTPNSTPSHTGGVPRISCTIKVKGHHSKTTLLRNQCIYFYVGFYRVVAKVFIKPRLKMYLNSV